RSSPSTRSKTSPGSLRRPSTRCSWRSPTRRSFEDLISRAKANPGKLSYSSVGIGTAHHLLGEWINAEAGVELTHVPYKGGTAPLTDVLSGQVDVLIETATSALPHLKSGRLRALAVTSTPGKQASETLQ